MARNRRSRNRSRGRNRGGAYAAPIAEPANFVELDVAPNSAGGLTYNDIFTALVAVIPASNIQKFRVSSVVCDPEDGTAASPNSGPIEVQMGLSGTHYQAKNRNIPLKIRLGKEYGDVGMWIITSGANAISADMLAGGYLPTSPWISSTRVEEYHIRIAWTDPT